MNEFKNLFKIPMLAMTINRSNPYIKRDKVWASQFVLYQVHMTSVFILLLYNIICFNLKTRDFSETCRNGIVLLIYCVITFKYCLILYHSQAIIGLIEDVKKDFMLSATFPVEERQVISKYALKGFFIAKLCMYFSFGSLVLFVMQNIFLFFYYYVFDEFKLVEFFEVHYPEVIEKRKDNLFVFCFIYTLFLGYASFTAVMYTAFVPLGPIFMIHASGQLALVERRMSKVFEEPTEEDTRMKIRSIIEDLQRIYDFVNRIKDSFKVAYELTLKGSSIALPIAVYDAVAAFRRNDISVESVMFSVGVICIVSTPCFYSEFLVNKGEDVRQAIYSCGWERRYDLRTRSTLHLMLVRAIRPTAIRTIFRTVCLEALTDVFQQAYAIFNLMNAMWN